jgi:hypothetical protein
MKAIKLFIKQEWLFLLKALTMSTIFMAVLLGYCYILTH